MKYHAKLVKRFTVKVRVHTAESGK